MTSSTLAFSGLLPHPPIVVPDVGRERLAECRQTLEACRAFARRLVGSHPDRLLLVSPHAPRQPAAFGLAASQRLRGDLAPFDAPQVAVDLPLDRALVDEIEATARAFGVATWDLPERPLDHGAVVPLSFLCEAGWAGPTAVVSLPGRGEPGRMAAFGRVVRAALDRLPGRAALVASGDMTHRASPGAPYGFDARGLQFDRQLTELVREGRLAGIGAIDPALRESACEDAADASTVVAAAMGYEGHGCEVLSYEHPFGVGYLVAVFHDGERGDER